MSDWIELFSPQPPEECARRLQEAIDLERWVLIRSGSWGGSRPVIGQVEGLSIRLRKRIGYSNGFQTFLLATMESDGTGTRIRGEFAMHASTRVFIYCWFGFLIFFTVMAVAGTVASAFSSSPARLVNWMILLVPLLMVAFGLTLVRLGRYLARHEAAFLTRFLCETLEAVGKPSGP